MQGYYKLCLPTLNIEYAEEGSLEKGSLVHLRVEVIIIELLRHDHYHLRQWWLCSRVSRSIIITQLRGIVI